MVKISIPLSIDPVKSFTSSHILCTQQNLRGREALFLVVLDQWQKSASMVTVTLMKGIHIHCLFHPHSSPLRQVLFLFPFPSPVAQSYSQRLNALPLKQKPINSPVGIQMRYLIQNHGLFPVYSTARNGVAAAPLLYTLEIISEFFPKEYLLNNLIQKEIASGIVALLTQSVSLFSMNTS